MMRRIMEWMQSKLSGHLSLSFGALSLTVYGFNAMHVAVNLYTPRWGYLCLHPPMYHVGRWHPWYFYTSPNATPWASTFAVGPGVGWQDKQSARLRRVVLGWQFSADDLYQDRWGSWTPIAVIMKDAQCPACETAYPHHGEGCSYRALLMDHPSGHTPTVGYVTNEDGCEWLPGHLTITEAMRQLVAATGEPFDDPKFYEEPAHSHHWMRCIGSTERYDGEEWRRCEEYDHGAERYTLLEF